MPNSCDIALSKIETKREKENTSEPFTGISMLDNRTKRSFILSMELQSSTAERRLHNVKTLYNVFSKSSLKSLNKMLVSKYVSK